MAYSHDDDDDVTVETTRYVWDEETGTFTDAPHTVPKRRIRGRFIRGPVLLWWIVKAFSLPGKAPNVAMALWYVWGYIRRQPFGLKADTLALFGVPHRDVYRRAIVALEGAGLIKVERKPGQSLAISIVLDDTGQNEDAAGEDEE